MTPPDRPPRRGLGRRKALKIEQLPDGVLRRYEREVLSDPRTLARTAQQWLAEQGYVVSLAAVLRHRRWLAQAEAGDARAAAVAGATRRRAAEQGLTTADLAAARDLHASHQLLAAADRAFDRVSATGRPAEPEEILALALAARRYTG